MKRTFLALIALATICLLMVSGLPITLGEDDPIDIVLQKGKQWLDHMYYEIDSNKAIVKTGVGLSLRVYDTATGTWYRAGDLNKKVLVEPLSTGNTQKAYYHFDTDSDINNDEPKIYVEYSNINSTHMKAIVQMVTCNHAHPENLEVYLDEHYVGNCGTGFNVEIIDWGFRSCQYATRHGVRMAYRYYDMIGETEKANKLKNFLITYGYDGPDFFDPLFGASNSYPDDFFHAASTYPDPELWWGLPSGPNYIPAATRLRYTAIRDFYITIYCKYFERGSAPYATMQALHLLNKYGSSKLDEAKSSLEVARWNGYGCGEPPYSSGVTGCFLAALSKYAQLSQDPKYLAWADRVAGVLIETQWTYPAETIEWGLLYKSDDVGGFMSYYVPIDAFAFKSREPSQSDYLFEQLDNYRLVTYNPVDTPMGGIAGIENTLEALAGLWLYKTLLPNRTPVKPSMLLTVKVNEPHIVVETGQGPGTWQTDAFLTGFLRQYVSSQLDQSGTKSRAGVIMDLTLSEDLENPTFSYSLADVGKLNAPNGGIHVAQYIKLTQGTTQLLYIENSIHNIGNGESWEGNASRTWRYWWKGHTLQKNVEYKIEIGVLVEADFLAEADYWNEGGFLQITSFYIDNCWNDDFEGDLSERWDILRVGITIADNDPHTLRCGIGGYMNDQYWGQHGAVTTEAYPMENFTMEVNVTELDELWQMNLLIAPTHVTASDPFNEDNWYRITKQRLDHSIRVEKKIDGVWDGMFFDTWLGATGTLRITICNGIISFYENGVFRYAEPYELGSENYIYLYASSDGRYACGTDAFDDFRYHFCNPHTTTDNFNDGDYDGWSVYSGSWSVNSGILYGSNGIIYNDQDFAPNRFIQTRMKTSTSPTYPWETAVLMIKWVDIGNQITTRIFSDGTLELCMWKNGQHVYNLQIATNLSPYVWHTFDVVVSGTNIKIRIDGTLYINENSEYFDDIAGTVGYQAGSVEAMFDDLKVTW